MKNSVPSENILKLRELTDRISKDNDDDYKAIVKKLKDIIDDGKCDVERCKTSQSKIKSYEAMYSKITNLLINTLL